MTVDEIRQYNEKREGQMYKSDESKAKLPLSEEEGQLGPIMSPKYHCELAGDGIEYSWGKSKFSFRRSNPGNAPLTELPTMVRAALRT